MNVRHMARRARAWARSASLVLLYHRVAEVDDDPWSLCVRPERFAAQMEALARRRDVVPLGRLAADLAAGRQPRAIAITFDDGYADFVDGALPVLARHGLPATLFATSGTLDGGQEFWWDDLERCILGPGTRPAVLALELRAGTRRWAVPGTPAARLGVYREVHAIVGRLAAAERAPVLDALRTWAGVDAAPRPSHRPLATAELAAVARHPLVELGAHTVNHPYLSALPEAEQRREIAGAKTDLEAVAGRPIARFSYPHGDRTPATDALVRAAGFAGACGSVSATARPGDDAFALPRVEVGDLDGPAFSRWLGEWVR